MYRCLFNNFIILVLHNVNIVISYFLIGNFIVSFWCRYYNCNFIFLNTTVLNHAFELTNLCKFFYFHFCYFERFFFLFRLFNKFMTIFVDFVCHLLFNMWYCYKLHEFLFLTNWDFSCDIFRFVIFCHFCFVFFVFLAFLTIFSFFRSSVFDQASQLYSNLWINFCDPY